MPCQTFELVKDELLPYVILSAFLSDADECKNSSTPVCHTNAKCQNTIGSFVCSCEPGFSGNAKTCWGKGLYYFALLINKHCVTSLLCA